MLRQFIKSIFVLPTLTLLLLTACTPNIPYHTNSINPDNTSTTTKPAGIQENNYDLAFIEFTDRGNVFDRKQMDNVLEHIDHYAKSDNGVTVITYIHGWKHNSSSQDPNLDSFKKMLNAAAKMKLTGKRKLIGIYIGWRGLSLTIPKLQNATYWSRKRVAHDVGKGGVTELLLKLEKSLYFKNQQAINPTKNVLVNTGHSMGGAILLSALHDILMSRILNTSTPDNNGCIKTEAFGHSTLLVNPAIEANEIFQLKELVKQNKCYQKNQDKLLHVISSDADMANKVAFKAGQWLGLSLLRSEKELKREYKHDEKLKKITIDEQDLDTITIANYPNFHTGRSRLRKDIQKEGKEHLCSNPSSSREECYIRCSSNNPDKCVDDKDKKAHIPVTTDEPLSFVYTDKEFMGNHNDIFQSRIAGYIATIVEEAQYKRRKNPRSGDKRIDAVCLNEKNEFNFSKCFELFKCGLELAIDAKKPSEQLLAEQRQTNKQVGDISPSLSCVDKVAALFQE